jgi:hypothetical protein
MTREKIDKVVNFPNPATLKDMKSFLGLVHVFRAIFHTVVTCRTLDMLADYANSWNRVLRWTEELEKAFEPIRRSIDACHTIFFVNEYEPVYLHTAVIDHVVGRTCRI